MGEQIKGLVHQTALAYGFRMIPKIKTFDRWHIHATIAFVLVAVFALMGCKTAVKQPKQDEFGRLRILLNILNDEEWEFIGGRIQVVLHEVKVESPLAASTPEGRKLQEVIDDHRPSPEIREALAQYRKAQGVGPGNTAAQKNLVNVLNLRQEAILVLQGLLR